MHHDFEENMEILFFWTNHVESKNNREFPLWYVLFPHHDHHTRPVDTLYFFPLGIKKIKEKLL